MDERTPEPPAPMAPVEQVHVAPLPPDHRPSLDCPCVPIPSLPLRGIHRVIVHRTFAERLDELLAYREGLR